LSTNFVQNKNDNNNNTLFLFFSYRQRFRRVTFDIQSSKKKKAYHIIIIILAINSFRSWCTLRFTHGRLIYESIRTLTRVCEACTNTHTHSTIIIYYFIIISYIISYIHIYILCVKQYTCGTWSLWLKQFFWIGLEKQSCH